MTRPAARTRSRPGRVTDRWSRSAVVGGVLAGSAVLVDPFGFQAFLTLRWAAAAIAVVVGAWWIAGHKRMVVPTSRVLLVGFVLLAVSLLVAAVASSAPMVSIFGASGRQMGVASWLLFAVAFLVGAGLFAAVERPFADRLVVAWFAAAVLVVGFVGMLEALGHPVVGASQSFGRRLQATFGNPAVLGAYLTLAIPPVAVALLNRVRPWLSGAGLVVAVVLLVASGTRGAWLGVAVAVVVIGVAGVRSTKGKRVLAGTLVVLALLAGLTVFTGRWGSAGGAIEGRVRTWQVAARVLAEHPWFGVGPEMFGEAFAEQVDETFVIDYSRDQVNDRAHNGLLDLAVSAGLIGLVGYLLVLGWVLAIAGRAVASNRVSMDVGFAAGIIAYLIQQQALFQLAAVDVVFWFLVGLLVVRVGATTRKVPPVWGAVAASLATLVAAYALLGVPADHADKRALESTSAQTAMASLERAAALRPFDTTPCFIASAVARQSGDPQTIADSLQLLAHCERWSPSSGELTLATTSVLVAQHAATSDLEPLLEARGMLETLVGRDRTNGAAYLRLGTIAYYLEDYDQAERYWTEAARLMPDKPEPKQNLAVLRRSSD